MRLHDKIHNTTYASEAARWLHYVNTTAVRAKPEGPLAEGFFEILYQEQLQGLGWDWVEVADSGGCAANDGWASTALTFWASRDGAELLGRARQSIAENVDWVAAANVTNGSYLFQRYKPYEWAGYTTELATSFAPAGVRRRVGRRIPRHAVRRRAHHEELDAHVAHRLEVRAPRRAVRRHGVERQEDAAQVRNRHVGRGGGSIGRGGGRRTQDGKQQPHHRRRGCPRTARCSC